MDILVTDSTTGAARAAANQLEAAGHRVHRCHEPSAPAFPCSGLVTECPLDATAIDLVLAVRPHIRTRPADTEAGVTCGLRQRIPVAVAGQTVMNPFEPLGAVPIEGDLVAACEQIAVSRRPEHEAAATSVLQSSLAAAGHPVEPSEVSVRRINGRLRVRVSVPEEVPEPAREMLAVRVVGRLREFDPYAVGIDIGVEPLDAESGIGS
jgi:hypothetical protein